MQRRCADSVEDGYIILFAVFLLALLVIALALAAPNVAKSIQRDRELETYNRGLQYRRAIQLYYRKFQAYPPNVDALVNTNNLRFLRKKYIDPLTGKDDWKPILFGQNKAPTAMGFFGQPLSGGASTIAGIGPGGGATGASGGSLPGGVSNLFGGSSGSSSGGSLPGGISDIFGGGSSGSSTANASNGSGGSSDASGSATSSGSSTASSGSSTGSSSGSTSTGLGGQTFGGGGIIGFEPVSNKPSILIYKKKDHYNQWEFTYDPISDMQTMAGGSTGLNGQSPGSATATPGGTTSSPSSSTTNSSSGSTSQP